jgi:hypothetical protein
MTVRSLTSIQEVVDALGGQAELRKLLRHGSSSGSISNYVKRGHISAAASLVIYKRLESLGYSVEPHVFGLDENWQPPVDTDMRLAVRMAAAEISRPAA